MGEPKWPHKCPLSCVMVREDRTHQHTATGTSLAPWQQEICCIFNIIFVVESRPIACFAFELYIKSHSIHTIYTEDIEWALMRCPGTALTVGYTLCESPLSPKTFNSSSLSVDNLVKPCSTKRATVDLENCYTHLSIWTAPKIQHFCWCLAETHLDVMWIRVKAWFSSGPLVYWGSGKW